jgi:hypothetical protein
MRIVIFQQQNNNLFITSDETQELIPRDILESMNGNSKLFTGDIDTFYDIGLIPLLGAFKANVSKQELIETLNTKGYYLG